MGTVTFPFTPIEGSTRLWEERPAAAMDIALARHDAILQGTITLHGGVVFYRIWRAHGRVEGPLLGEGAGGHPAHVPPCSPPTRLGCS